MGIEFSKLQADFREYLLTNGDITQEEYDNDTSGVSIFSHMTEFKQYLKSEYNCSDVSIFSMDLSEILKMDIENGKLVNPDEKTEDTNEDNPVENPDETAETPEGEIATPTEGTSNGEEIETAPVEGEIAENVAPTEEDANAINLENIDMITGILNDLMQDDTVKGVIDIDTDGELSDEEVTDFIEKIKGYDKDEESISLDDIMKALEEIQAGTFNKPEVEETTEEEKEEPITKPQETQTTAPSNRASGASGGGGNRSVGGSSGGSTPTTSEPVEKTLDDMTKEELTEELNTAESDLTTKQDALSSILDGSDPTISGLKETMENAFEVYQEELAKVDEDMAEELQTLKDAISAKEQEIDAKEQEIVNQETVVSESEAAYDNAVSTKESWEDIVSSLEATDTSEMSDEKKGEIGQKLADARQKLQDATTAVTEAKEKKDAAKEKLDALKEEKEKLISGDDETCLDALNQQMQDLETQIAEKYPELQEYMKAYDDAKTEYSDTKAEMTTNAKNAVAESQSYVNEVQTAINNFDNRESEKDYTINDLQGAIDWARKYDNYSQSEIRGIFAELGYQFDENLWCADFVRMALGEGVGDENLPEWYQNCPNKAYCPSIQSSGEGHQVSAEDAQPGDIVLFDWDGDGEADHVGLFIDNGDGSSTITTIEGNTSGEGGSSCVEEQARYRNTVLGIYSMKK